MCSGVVTTTQKREQLLRTEAGLLLSSLQEDTACPQFPCKEVQLSPPTLDMRGWSLERGPNMPEVTHLERNRPRV